VTAAENTAAEPETTTEPGTGAAPAIDGAGADEAAPTAEELAAQLAEDFAAGVADAADVRRDFDAAGDGFAQNDSPGAVAVRAALPSPLVGASTTGGPVPIGEYVDPAYTAGRDMTYFLIVYGRAFGVVGRSLRVWAGRAQSWDVALEAAAADYYAENGEPPVPEDMSLWYDPETRTGFLRVYAAYMQPEPFIRVPEHAADARQIASGIGPDEPMADEAAAGPGDRL
jgi:hypothetical protein